MALSAADRGARTGRRLTPATRAALQAGLTLREVSTPPKFPRLAPDARLTSEPQATLLCHPTLTGTPGQTSGFWQTPRLGAVCTFGVGGGTPALPSLSWRRPSPPFFWGSATVYLVFLPRQTSRRQGTLSPPGREGRTAKAKAWAATVPPLHARLGTVSGLRPELDSRPGLGLDAHSIPLPVRWPSVWGERRRDQCPPSPSATCSGAAERRGTKRRAQRRRL